MKQIVSRRTFIAGLATASAGAACSKPATPPDARAQGSPAEKTEQTYPLTVYFTGLVFFQASGSEMKVGLLDHDHETIVVARKADVSSYGTDLNGNQYDAWNPADLSMDMEDLTYWKGTTFAMGITSTESLTIKAPLQVFPLRALSKVSPTLAAGPGGNCQSLLSFTQGTFRGQQRTHSCGHEMANWKMVKSAGAKPVLTEKLRDTVKYSVQVTKGSFTIDRTTIDFKSGNVAIWVMQLDKKGATGKDPLEVKHAQHFYDLLKDYKGDKYYPRRDSVPESCKVQIDVDPIYCTPGEDR